MISTQDFKKGTKLEINGEPYTILDVASQSPTARGSTTLVKTKMRNLITGQFSAQTFKAGEKFQEPDLENRNCSYLYHDGEHYHFMDKESYEQHQMTADEVGDARNFLVENSDVKVVLFNAGPVGVEVASTVILNITECAPAVRGDTVNAVTKAATLETGYVVQVPMFVEPGEQIKVDTRDGRYLSRVR
jgi:elongation factor P